MTASGAVVWRHARSLAVVESADRIALLDLEQLADPPRILEGSAAVIWKAVDGHRSAAGVVEAVAESFGLPVAELEEDVVEFLDSLAAAGLLEGS